MNTDRIKKNLTTQIKEKLKESKKPQPHNKSALPPRPTQPLPTKESERNRKPSIGGVGTIFGSQLLSPLMSPVKRSTF